MKLATFRNAHRFRHRLVSSVQACPYHQPVQTKFPLTIQSSHPINPYPHIINPSIINNHPAATLPPAQTKNSPRNLLHPRKSTKQKSPQIPFTHPPQTPTQNKKKKKKKEKKIPSSSSEPPTPMQSLRKQPPKKCNPPRKPCRAARRSAPARQKN